MYLPIWLEIAVKIMIVVYGFLIGIKIYDFIKLILRKP